MMTRQPLFLLADTPDVDLEQAGGTNVAVGRDVRHGGADPARQHIPGAITSAVDIVSSGRSNSRPARAACSDIYLFILFHASVAGRGGRDRRFHGHV